MEVEFLDSSPAGPGGDDLVESGDHSRRPRRFRYLGPALVVLLVAGALIGGRFVSGTGRPHATATASPSPSARTSAPVGPPVFGLVGLPSQLGEPRTMVTAGSGDVVWVLDRGAGIVRIENGHRTAATLLESQVTAIAVNPAGTRLYVATGANRRAVQFLDATTLTPGRSVTMPADVQALAVSTDAVWAATGADLLRLDLDSLRPLATLVMPGVLLTQHLRVQIEGARSDQEFVIGLVTSPNDVGTTTSRFVRVDPLTQQIAFGPVLPHVTDVATTHYLTWATTSDTPPVTEGYESVLDPVPATDAVDPLTAGSRIYDGGAGFAAFVSVAPDSSVVTCRDDGGHAVSEVDVAPAVPGAVVTGQVLRTATAFYVITDRGLVRSGIGDCA